MDIHWYPFLSFCLFQFPISISALSQKGSFRFENIPQFCDRQFKFFYSRFSTLNSNMCCDNRTTWDLDWDQFGRIDLSSWVIQLWLWRQTWWDKHDIVYLHCQQQHKLKENANTKCYQEPHMNIYPWILILSELQHRWSFMWQTRFVYVCLFFFLSWNQINLLIILTYWRTEILISGTWLETSFSFQGMFNDIMLVIEFVHICHIVPSIWFLKREIHFLNDLMLLPGL